MRHDVDSFLSTLAVQPKMHRGLPELIKLISLSPLRLIRYIIGLSKLGFRKLSLSTYLILCQSVRTFLVLLGCTARLTVVSKMSQGIRRYPLGILLICVVSIVCNYSFFQRASEAYQVIHYLNQRYKQGEKSLIYDVQVMDDYCAYEYSNVR